MHPPMHTAAHRVPAGFVTAMESTWPERHRQAGLTIAADMFNHRGEVGPEFRKKLVDFVKPPFQEIKAGPQGSTARRDVTPVLLRTASEHPVKAFRLPSESHGQGFEGAAATAALHGMPLDLPHDCQRDMRTLRKLALTPAKLTDTVADNPRDRRPVLKIAVRHARSFRAPLPAPTLADRTAIPHEIGTNRNQTKASRNTYGAEISAISMISTHKERWCAWPPRPQAANHQRPYKAAERTDAI
jgi:hypothetical protein